MSHHSFRKRRNQGVSNRRKAGTNKPASSATLARREVRLANLIAKLEALQADPAYQAREDSRKKRLVEIDCQLKQLIGDHLLRSHDAEDAAMAKITCILQSAAANYRDDRSWWRRITEPLPDFRYALPCPYLDSDGRKISSSPMAGRSYGKFRPSEATLKLIEDVEDEYIAANRSIDRDIEESTAALKSERLRLTAERINSKTTYDLPLLKSRLRECQDLLKSMSHDEETLRRLYGTDEHTIAKAAAHDGQTRKLASRLRPTLHSQLTKVERCPYCDNEFGGVPHADHIVPVSLGGLSTTQNLVFVCSECNLRKSDLTLREFCKKFDMDRDFIESRLASLGKRV